MTTKPRGVGVKGLSGRTIKRRTFFAASLSRLKYCTEINDAMRTNFHTYSLYGFYLLTVMYIVHIVYMVVCPKFGCPVQSSNIYLSSSNIDFKQVQYLAS